MLRMRYFSPNDLGEVMKLVYTALGENYSESSYINIYNNWHEGFIIAELDGHLVGFIAGVLSDKKSARILMLAVRDELRCRGFGTALLGAFFNQCSLKGLKTVHLEVRSSNAGAIRFYTKFGFQIARVLPRYYTDGEDGYQMWRSL